MGEQVLCGFSCCVCSSVVGLWVLEMNVMHMLGYFGPQVTNELTL